MIERPDLGQDFGEDVVSKEAERKLVAVLIAISVGVGIGLFTLRAAGTTGSPAWLIFLIVGIAAVAFLARYMEAGLIGYLGLAWVAIGTPTIAQGGSGSGQRLLISQLGLGLLLALWVGRQLIRQKWEIPKTPVTVPIFVFLFFAIWSTINGVLFPNHHVLEHSPKQYLLVNVLEIGMRVLSLGGLLMIAGTLRGRLLRIAALVIIMPGLASYSGILFFLPRSVYLAFPQILAMAVLAAFALAEGEKWSVRIVCGAIAFSIFGVYFLKGTEWVSGWFGAGVALALIGLRVTPKLFWSVVAAIALIILLNFSYFYQKVYVENFYVKDAQRHRIDAKHLGTFTNDRTRMLYASGVYAYHFPLGIGLGNYRSYNEYFGRPDVWNTTTFTSAHGTYAQHLSEMGWTGLLSLLAFLFMSGRCLKRTYEGLPPGRPKRFALGAWGGCIGIYAASFNGDYLFPSYHNGGLASFGACVYVHLIVGITLAFAQEAGIDLFRTNSKPAQ